MQEPEIFEQPVRTKDPEAIVTGEETGTYHTGYSGFQTNATDESSLDDYHDFVYPEGEFAFPPVGRSVLKSHFVWDRPLIYFLFSISPSTVGRTILTGSLSEGVRLTICICDIMKKQIEN